MGSGLTMSTHFPVEDPNAPSGSHSCSDISITQQVASVSMMHVCIAQAGSRCKLSAMRMCGKFPVGVLLERQQPPSGEAADHRKQQPWLLCSHTSTADWARVSRWVANHASRPCNATARHVLLQMIKGAQDLGHLPHSRGCYHGRQWVQQRQSCPLFCWSGFCLIGNNIWQAAPCSLLAQGHVT